MKRYLIIWLCIITVTFLVELKIPNIHAKEFRGHAAHEHGVAKLNIAFEGKELYIELTTPAANIVGFEHQPRTQEQKAIVKEAIKSLKPERNVLSYPPEPAANLSSLQYIPILTANPVTTRKMLIQTNIVRRPTRMNTKMKRLIKRNIMMRMDTNNTASLRPSMVSSVPGLEN